MSEGEGRKTQRNQVDAHRRWSTAIAGAAGVMRYALPHAPPLRSPPPPPIASRSAIQRFASSMSSHPALRGVLGGGPGLVAL